MIYKLIGLTAASLTMFSFFPQVFKTLRTKSIKDVSIFTLFQLSLGVLLWIIYGLYLKDFIIVLANSVTLLSLVILIALYYNYKSQN
ncbi:MAG: SemiSWEET family transporter [Candidatus Omnitrophica bacterium]|nr:SemiSWEET family transporter [Candidatus Omnitrophota bacterium]